MNERKAVDLGWCVAVLDIKAAKLTIISPSDGAENVYCPAESVSVFSLANIRKLRDLLKDADIEDRF